MAHQVRFFGSWNGYTNNIAVEPAIADLWGTKQNVHGNDDFRQDGSMSSSKYTATDLIASRPEVLAVDWSDYHLFSLMCAAPSLRTAAAKAGVSAATVMRRLNRLEERLGVRLLNRSMDGVTLTVEGEWMRIAVEGMLAPLADISRVVERISTDRAFFSVTLTPGLATNYLLPRFAEFQRENTDIGVEFRITSRLADITRFDSDIALQFTDPTSQDIVAKQVGVVFSELFASRGYLDRAGRPASIEDLRRHVFVQQLDDHFSKGHLPALLGQHFRPEAVVVKVWGSLGAIRAIESGMGMGVLPTYSIAVGNQLEAVGLPLRIQNPVWLTYRPCLTDDPRAKRLVGWLREQIDPKVFKWFSKGYVAP
jgi:DNA-binding transcriptional LysR family regulator